MMLLGFNGLYEDADTDAANGFAGDVITDYQRQCSGGWVAVGAGWSARWHMAARAPAPASPTSRWSAIPRPALVPG